MEPENSYCTEVRGCPSFDGAAAGRHDENWVVGNARFSVPRGSEVSSFLTQAEERDMTVVVAITAKAVVR